MQQADRIEFEAQARTLFAGLGLSAHDSAERLAERIEGWWIGLQRMPLLTFVRAVEHLLAMPAWPEYLPRRRTDLVPGDLWKVVREMRAGRNEPTEDGRNVVRDQWRSFIVPRVAEALGLSVTQLEPLIIAHAETLGAAMRSLLDELESAERREGRTDAVYRTAVDSCRRIGASYRGLTPMRGAA